MRKPLQLDVTLRILQIKQSNYMNRNGLIIYSKENSF